MTILAAIDGERGSNQIVEIGNDLAKAYDEDLIVMHAVPESEDQAYAETTARQVLANVFGEEIPNRIDILGVLYGTKGIASKLLTIAEDRDPSYIVLGSQKRSPAGKAILGSVSQEVLLNTDRPVVIAGKRRVA